MFETICEKFRQYGNTKNEVGKKSVVRMVSRDGKPLVLKDIHITMEGMKLLTHTVCIDSKDDLKVKKCMFILPKFEKVNSYAI